MRISHWKWDCLKKSSSSPIISIISQARRSLRELSDHSEITHFTCTHSSPDVLSLFRCCSINQFKFSRKPHMKMGPTQSHPALLQPIWNHHAATVKTGTMQKLYIFGIVHYFPFASLPLDFWLVCPLILTILPLDFDQFVLRFWSIWPFLINFLWGNS